MKLIWVLLVLALFNTVFSDDCTCGRKKAERIIGGTEANIKNIPWMAELGITDEDGSFNVCGGTIISKDYILTAAHCLKGATQVQVQVGKETDSKKYRDTEKFFHHPKFQLSLPFYDVGLVKMKEPMQFSSKIQPVCLPPADMDTSGELTVSGWGTTETDDFAHKLRYAHIKEDDFDKCNNDDWGGMLDKTMQFCAGIQGKGACTGDSGGPITKDVDGVTYNIGIVSFGSDESDNCGNESSSVYTKVTRFLDWIKENTQDTTFCSQ